MEAPSATGFLVKEVQLDTRHVSGLNDCFILSQRPWHISFVHYEARLSIIQEGEPILEGQRDLSDGLLE